MGECKVGTRVALLRVRYGAGPYPKPIRGIDMNIDIQVVETERLEGTSDEVWVGELTIQGKTFLWYATADMILIDGISHKWPCAEVEVAVAICALTQFSDMF